MRLAKALFGQVGDQVGQVRDLVGQGQGQELDNNSGFNNSKDDTNLSSEYSKLKVRNKDDCLLNDSKIENRIKIFKNVADSVYNLTIH